MHHRSRPPAFLQHVERLFIADDAQPLLRRGGLPEQPTQWRDVPQAGWEHWEHVPCMVLLGSPSMGKTSEFEYQHAKCRVRGQHAFLTRWQDWTDGDDLLDLVDDPVAFRAALASGQPVTWFVDSLDEGRLQSQAAFARLQASLKELQRRGQLAMLRLRLSCRASEWRANDQDGLRRLFEQHSPPAPVVVAVRLLPLTEPAVRTLSAEKLPTTAQVEAFMTAMRARHVSMLAGHPLVLALMLDEYRESGRLGGDRTAVYDAAVDRLIREANTFRLGGPSPATSLKQRRRAAEELAARLVLGGHSLVARPEHLRAPGVLDAEQVPVDTTELRAVLETGLFFKLGDESHGFLHRGFAEFLAARRLAEGLESGWPLRSVLPLFPTAQGGVPSPLRETAAWLAGLVPAFQSWLVQHDPATACLGDTLRYTPANRLALVKMLAGRYRDRRWQTEFDRFGDLAATIPETELRQLLDRGNGLAVREMAINMVETSARDEFHDLLMERALDDREDPAVRTRAVMVLGAANAAGYATPLSALLTLDAALDPEDEICGAVLHQLYPDHLTTGQAVSALRVQRAAGVSGLFRLFWNHEFLQRLPAHAADRHESLQALGRLFADQAGDADDSALHFGDRDAHRVAIGLAPLFGTYVELVVRELNTPEHTIEVVGPHLTTIRRWAHRFGHVDRVSALEQLIRTSTSLRRELLDWCLASVPDGSALDVWELPFISQRPVADDFELFAAACTTHAQQTALAAPLFQFLVQVAYQFPATTQIERIQDLAEKSEALSDLWKQRRECSLDLRIPESRRRHADAIEAQRQQALASRAKWVSESIGALRAGDGDALVTTLWEAGSDPFAPPALERVKEQFGPEIARAIAEGLRRIWTDFNDVTVLWPSRPPHSVRGATISNRAIAAGLGFQWVVAPDDDLRSLSDAQMECVLWLSLNGDGDWLPMFRRAWQARPDVVWRRFEALLDHEGALPRDAPDRLWSRLAVTDSMPTDFIAQLLRYAEEHALPHHAGARLHLYAFARRHGDPGTLAARMQPVLRADIEAAWARSSRPAAEDEYAELAVLAMAWLLDRSVVDAFGAAVFSGVRHCARALGFVSALQHILSPDNVIAAQWDRSVPFEDYAELLPHLFYEASPQPQEAADKLDVPAQLALDARNRLVSHLASAPPVQAEDWFAQWRVDDRFGSYRDWLASLHAEVRRQVADGQWRALTQQECDAVLLRKGALVRTCEDVKLYLDELMESKVCPAFRTDHALTPLLWGKKGTKPGSREHVDEKTLQTALYGAIRMLMTGMPIFGAREPEQFDAKKPDLRLGFALDSGAVVDVPIEIKWSDNDELCEAPKHQLLAKYMLDPAVRHGLYLVAWASARTVVAGPSGERHSTPHALRIALQAVADAAVAGTDKTISVHVLDVSVPT